MDEKKSWNVLILDPEQDTARLFTRALESRHESCKCYWVRTADEARALIEMVPFSLVLADLSALQRDRFMLLNNINREASSAIILIDAFLNQSEGIKRTLGMGATGYFIKPIMVGAFRKIVDDLTPRLSV